MHRISTRRVLAWTGALAVVLVAATAVVAFASNQIRAAKAPTVTNGGARQWVAFDPEGRSIGPVQFLSKTISIVSTSTARNSFTLYYEPAHTLICASAVGPSTSGGSRSDSLNAVRGLSTLPASANGGSPSAPVTDNVGSQVRLSNACTGSLVVGCTVSPAFEFSAFELAPPGWRPG